jgi:hypothetical protein
MALQRMGGVTFRVEIYAIGWGRLPLPKQHFEEKSMRTDIRSYVAALSIAFLTPLAFVGSSGAAFAQAAQSDQPPEAVQQVALTEKQILGYLAAQADIDAIMAKLPQGDSQPNAKVMAQLDGVAKKHGFASYADYDLVGGNIGLVLAGIDPQSKKYVGAEAVFKMQIVEVQADKKISDKDKKDALEQLNAEIKSAVAVTIPGNITLVVKYYDKLAATMQQSE